MLTIGSQKKSIVIIFSKAKYIFGHKKRNKYDYFSTIVEKRRLECGKWGSLK